MWDRKDGLMINRQILRWQRGALLVTSWLWLQAAAGTPSAIGQAFSITPSTVAVSTSAIKARVSAVPGEPELTFANQSRGRLIEIPHLFTVVLKDGVSLNPLNLHWSVPFSAEDLMDSGKGQAKEFCAELASAKPEGEFHWCLIVRADSGYMREELTIRAGKEPLQIARVELLEFNDPDASVMGTVKGSPIADDRLFFGVEHPLSWSRVQHGTAEAGIDRELALKAHDGITYSAVIGAYTPGQLRRAFLAYLESERPRRYSPFLNYNTWYDVGYQNRYSENDVLSRIDAFGEELERKREVKIDSFVLDDGWDNPQSLWGFNNELPNGFSRLASHAGTYRAGLGVWLSPWGGYAQQKIERVAYGRSHGYEIVNQGFALSGPKYFREFSDVCFEMIDKYNVNLFKFDGTGNADRVFPGSEFDSDFDAAIYLIHEIRARKPGIFINLTTGTYPSPFWLFYADSIWRGGEDHNFDGVGSQRQRWITYRDEQTYRNIVQRGPLFPLNSLMLHGIIYAKQAEGLSIDPGHDFRDEVVSYFASGTQLQEMYVTPSLLTQSDWEVLAKAAKWSRENAAVLKDTHWIGGDPGQQQVYGWAAWSPQGWTVALRNPSARPQDYRLDLEKALELPNGGMAAFAVTEPFATAPKPLRWNRNDFVTISLKPFEVRVFTSDSKHDGP